MIPSFALGQYSEPNEQGVAKVVSGSGFKIGDVVKTATQ